MPPWRPLAPEGLQSISQSRLKPSPRTPKCTVDFIVITQLLIIRACNPHPSYRFFSSVPELSLALLLIRIGFITFSCAPNVSREILCLSSLLILYESVLGRVWLVFKVEASRVEETEGRGTILK